MMSASVVNKSSKDSLILLDTHVHLHRCFDLSQVFASASENFAKQASHLGKMGDYFSCLMLTEMQGEDWFLQQHDLVQNQSSKIPIKDDWILSATSEVESLLVENTASNTQLALLAGRQIVTQERLEVLALLTPAVIPDGLSLNKTVEAIIDEKGIPVLPWGVGKWIGPRGRLVAEFLQRSDTPKVFLGDNSGRPLGWRRPIHFKLAEQQGIPVLPGTDPLPLPEESSKVGSFGLQISGNIDAKYPGRAIRTMLQSLSLPIQAFGHLELPWRFVQNQVALRVQKSG